MNTAAAIDDGLWDYLLAYLTTGVHPVVRRGLAVRREGSERRALRVALARRLAERLRLDVAGSAS
jgi:hypothetical protein